MSLKILPRIVSPLVWAPIYLVIGLFFPVFTQAEEAPVPVKVGGYLFEPFVSHEQSHVTGLTLDLIDLLNQQQSKYQFEFVSTSPKRRYIDFNRHEFDVMFFESKNWGWQTQPINASRVFLRGGEVFIAQAHDDRDQTFFDYLNDKTLVGILGYHYGFAKFDADETRLKQAFDITLVNSPKTIINQILGGKADVGVVTISYLKKQIKQMPELAEKLLVSDKLDQSYQHTILVRENHTSPSLDEINALIGKLLENGSLSKLLLNYGIEPL